jgi:succinate dehydrogenase hydrophobic anchor subunit
MALLVGAPVSTGVDLLCGVVVPLHAHIGMRSIVLDYVHDVSTQRVVLASLALFTVASAAGLTYFNLTDVGLTEGLKALWVAQPAPLK